MAFTQVEVTGVVQLQNAQPASGAVVSFLLSEEISDGSTAVYPQALTTRCASDGSFSITVNALDDDTTNPKGAFYTAQITYGSQQLGSLQVVVSAADAPTVDLYSLLAPSGSPASGVTQLQAGDGISLDPGSGLGIVTITATGGGGGSIDSVTGDSPINAETVDGAVTLSMVEDAYDAYGAAATAQENAETFATDAITALDLGTASTHAATDFDAAGSASAAQENAESYTDSQLESYAELSGATFTGEVGITGSSQFTASDEEDGPVMRVGQKSNGESVWSSNVDQNNGDAIDDPTVSAWKLSMEGGPDYDAVQFQHSPPGDSWDGSQVFQVDGDGNLVLGGSATVNGDETVATEDDLESYAPLDSPELTGTPTAPTASSGTNSTQVATTAFVAGAVDVQGTQAYGTLTTTNDTEQTVTISEGGDYEPVTWGSAGTADGVTLDADAGTITVGTTGAYLFALDLIVKATGTGKELAMSFCVNGEQVLEVVGAYALSGVAQAHFSGNFTGAFNEGDVVSVQVTTTDAASTLVVTDGQFSALQSVALSGDAGVASVNDQTGVVTLSAGDVGAIGLGGELVEGNLIQASSDGAGEDSGLASSSVESVVTAGPAVRAATVSVAASDATANELAQADYVCTGTADQTVINTALTAVASNGGIVKLSSGTFNLTGSIVFTANYQVIQGAGMGATLILAPAVQAAITWNGITSCLFCCVRDVYIQDGVYALYFAPLATTVASGSNGGTIANIATWGGTYGGNGVLDVASTTGYPSSGSLTVATSGTAAVINYTGIAGNTFTGCTYVSGSGTVATGGAVAADVNFWDFVARDVTVYGTSSDGFYAYDGHGYVLDHFIAEDTGGHGVNFPTTCQSEPEVRNGTYKFNSGGGVFMGAPGGIVAENEFESITGIAINLQGAGSRATDNIIGETGTGASTVGINMQAAGCVAKGNYVANCGSNGIQLFSIGCTAIGNYLTANTGAHIYATQPGSLVIGNFCLYGSSYGIEVNTPANVSVIGNYVQGAALAGIYINAAANCTVQGNILRQNVQYGILSNSTGTSIQGNTLFSSSNTTANSYDEINVSGSGAVVTGNTINGNSHARYGVNFSGSATTGNVCSNNTVSGTETASYGASTYNVAWTPVAVLAKAASYSLAAIDTNVVFTITGAATATLPSAVTAGSGRQYTITNANASTSALTIAATAGTTPVATLAAAATLRVISDGTNWQAC